MHVVLYQLVHRDGDPIQTFVEAMADHMGVLFPRR
jgi:hypothetical protein